MFWIVYSSNKLKGIFKQLKKEKNLFFSVFPDTQIQLFMMKYWNQDSYCTTMGKWLVWRIHSNRKDMVFENWKNLFRVSCILCHFTTSNNFRITKDSVKIHRIITGFFFIMDYTIYLKCGEYTLMTIYWFSEYIQIK